MFVTLAVVPRKRGDPKRLLYSAKVAKAQVKAKLYSAEVNLYSAKINLYSAKMNLYLGKVVSV